MIATRVGTGEGDSSIGSWARRRAHNSTARLPNIEVRLKFVLGPIRICFEVRLAEMAILRDIMATPYDERQRGCLFVRLGRPDDDTSEPKVGVFPSFLPFCGGFLVPRASFKLNLLLTCLFCKNTLLLCTLMIFVIASGLKLGRY